MFAKRATSCLLVCLLMPMFAVYAQDKHTFSLPDSVLLFGTYNELRLVTPERVQVIKPPVEMGANSGYFLYPNLSPKGDYVAWAFAVDYQKNRPRYTIRMALGVYSIKEQKWKTYGDFDQIGTPTFSPDGAKLVFMALDSNGYYLRMFDVATEKMTTLEKLPVKGIPEKSTLGWSSDGKRLVVEFERRNQSALIAIVDLASGEVKALVEGYSPAWSPSGEWIAYHDGSGGRCMLIRPDGSGARMVSKLKNTFFTKKGYNEAVVWSPDEKKLLVNELRSRPYGANDVVLINLETGQATKKTENGLTVFGWVARGK